MNHAPYIIRALPYSENWIARSSMLATARVDMALDEDFKDRIRELRAKAVNVELFDTLLLHKACISGLSYSTPAKSWAHLGEMLYADDPDHYWEWCKTYLPDEIVREINDGFC